LSDRDLSSVIFPMCCFPFDNSLLGIVIRIDFHYLIKRLTSLKAK
jgi:hypothetical protein